MSIFFPLGLCSTGGDPSAASAIASFLSILLPLIQVGELSTAKAKDTISILAEFLKENNALPTGTVRSIVRVLGLLVLSAELDWEALELPLDTLLAFSVDKRPKVLNQALSTLLLFHLQLAPNLFYCLIDYKYF